MGTAGFGLFSIRERITSIGGEFRIQSTQGRGTQATLLVSCNLALPTRQTELDVPMRMTHGQNREVFWRCDGKPHEAHWYLRLGEGRRQFPCNSYMQGLPGAVGVELVRAAWRAMALFCSKVRTPVVARAQEPDPVTNSGGYSGRGAPRNYWRFSHYPTSRYRCDSVGPGFGEQKVVTPATPDLMRYFQEWRKE